MPYAVNLNNLNAGCINRVNIKICCGTVYHNGNGFICFGNIGICELGVTVNRISEYLFTVCIGVMSEIEYAVLNNCGSFKACKV